MRHTYSGRKLRGVGNCRREKKNGTPCFPIYRGSYIKVVGKAVLGTTGRVNSRLVSGKSLKRTVIKILLAYKKCWVESLQDAVELEHECAVHATGRDRV